MELGLLFTTLLVSQCSSSLDFSAFAFGAGAAEIRVMATSFEFAVVHLMAVDEFGTGAALFLLF